MRYQDTKEKSAEYLRQALPLMQRQPAALHPVSYAVWYEYVADMNGPLKDHVDHLLSTGQALDEDQTGTLFRRHIAEMDEAAAQRIAQGFQRMLTRVSDSMSQAGEQVDRFGHTLEQLNADLQEPDASGVTRDQLLEDTRQMQVAIAELQASLEASKSEVERLQQEVTRARQEAQSDGLTGLMNRRGFDEALRTCLAESEGRNVSLLITDIDHFKRINDSYGHLFGDRVIRAVAEVIKANVNGRDLAARYGGEEFVMLLPDTSVQGARIVAEKIRSTIAASRIRRHNSNEPISNITVSLGVCAYQEGESVEDFIGRADKALYVAKEQGRNRVTVAAA